MKTPLAVVLLLVTTTHTASSLSIRRHTSTNTRSAIISICQIHTANAVISSLSLADQHRHRHSSLFVRRQQFLQATISAAKATSTQLAYYPITSDNDSSSSSRGSHSSSSSSSSSWLDRTTSKILSSSSLDDDEYVEQQQQQRLTCDDVTLITQLMSAHARRGTVTSAVICERLLHRVVMEVDRNSRDRNNSYHNNQLHHHNANVANDRQRRNKTNTHQQLDNNSNEYEDDDYDQTASVMRLFRVSTAKISSLLSFRTRCS